MATTNDSKEMDNDSDDILEKSPCGRWEKYKKQLSAGEIPGIDTAYMAMDTEKGVEVVWNEINVDLNNKDMEIPDFKNNVLKSISEFLQYFCQPIQKITHANLVKFHSIWLCDNEKIKLVFITEFMAGGCLRNVLRKTRANKRKIALKTWKRWCKEILTVINFLHTQQITYIHGSIGCASIFIQHTGAIKLNVICADTIKKHIENIVSKISTLNYSTLNANSFPGYVTSQLLIINSFQSSSALTDGTSTDIYDFGLVALEIALLGLTSLQSTTSLASSSSSNLTLLNLANNQTTLSLCISCCSNITNEMIDTSLDRLDNIQSDFIRQCLNKNMANGYLNPSIAIKIITHPAIMDVPSLKVLAGHLVNNNFNPESIKKFLEKTFDNDPEKPIAVVSFNQKPECSQIVKFKQIPRFDIEQLLRQIRSGLHPLLPSKLSYSAISNSNTNLNTINASKSPQKIDEINNKADGPHPTTKKHVSASVSSEVKSKNPSPFNISLNENDFNPPESKSNHIREFKIIETQSNQTNSIPEPNKISNLAENLSNHDVNLISTETRRVIALKCAIQQTINQTFNNLLNLTKIELNNLNNQKNLTKMSYLCLEFELIDRTIQCASTILLPEDTGHSIALDLVRNSLLSTNDYPIISELIESFLRKINYTN